MFKRDQDPFVCRACQELAKSYLHRPPTQADKIQSRIEAEARDAYVPIPVEEWKRGVVGGRDFTFKCKHCPKIITDKKLRAYCSSECHIASKTRIKTWFNCLICNAPFLERSFGINKYCNQSCGNKGGNETRRNEPRRSSRNIE